MLSANRNEIGSVDTSGEIAHCSLWNIASCLIHRMRGDCINIVINSSKLSTYKRLSVLNTVTSTYFVCFPTNNTQNVWIDKTSVKRCSIIIYFLVKVLDLSLMFLTSIPFGVAFLQHLASTIFVLPFADWFIPSLPWCDLSSSMYWQDCRYNQLCSYQRLTQDICA